MNALDDTRLLGCRFTFAAATNAGANAKQKNSLARANFHVTTNIFQSVNRRCPE
jgi:hypothetical protein